MNNPSKHDLILDWIKEFFARARGLLVPLSGGSDSALCFWLVNQVYPGKVLGVHVGNSLRCACWFESVGKVRYLAPLDLEGVDRESARWMQFHSICLKEHCWLLGSRNKTEEVFGTYSLASRLSTYLPLAGFWKSEVLELCRQVGVPDEIIASSRQADPECGRPVEMAAIPIEQVNLYLRTKIGESSQPGSLSDEQFQYLERTFKVNEFKKGLPLRGLQR